MVSPPDKCYPRRLQTPVMKDNRTSRFIKSAILAAGLALANFSHAADPHYWQWAQTPPMGWNSWDSFGAGVWQADVLANADYMDKNLKAHGWNIITIDIQWYEPLAHTTSYRKGAILETDANGRLLPATNRFPMTAENRSFKPIADYLHARGLKFGLHLMRGVPRQSVDRDNALILGTTNHVSEIADKVHVCRWNTDMYGVDMSKPGAQEYYNSVFALLASWDLDFVKVDDLAGHEPEIEAVRKAIDKTGRPIVFSISPHGSTVARGEFVSTNANMWRISGDFWDRWDDLDRAFDLLGKWQRVGGPGHWPDADMIPFGHIGIKCTIAGNDRKTRFTKDEQVTLMSLWALAPSPLMLGNNLPDTDEWTLSLLTNDDVLAVNQDTLGITARRVMQTKGTEIWVKPLKGGAKAIGLFNRSSAAQSVELDWKDAGLTGKHDLRDLWSHKDLGAFDGKYATQVPSHGTVLLFVK